MRVELEEYGADALERTLRAVIEDSKEFEMPGGFEAPMSAHIVTAAK